MLFYCVTLDRFLSFFDVGEGKGVYSVISKKFICVIVNSEM